MNLTIEQVAKITAGEPDQTGASLSRSLTGVSIDSRSIMPGALFIAIRGQRCDGHDFLEQAAQHGAAAALVSRVPATPIALPLVHVTDTVHALHDLARHVRAGTTTPVVGITGSTGKTTTKEFAATLLDARGPVLKTEGNLNNQYGVPLTLLRLRSEHSAAVVEMGMSAPGELRRLTRMANPDAAVITNVAPVHLEFFASLEAIAQAKAEIFEGIRNGGWTALNHDDPHVRRIGESFHGEVLWFGSEQGCDVRVRACEEAVGRIAFVLEVAGKAARVSLGMPGRHAMMNFAAAATVAHRLGLPFDDIVQATERLAPAPHRGELLELRQDTLLIDDSYNSNPSAVIASVETITQAGGRRRVAFLGEMLELGPRSPELHAQVGERIAAAVDVLAAVGPMAREFLEGARRAGHAQDRLHFFNDAAAAACEAPGLVRPGDLILVKGSRGVRMERVVEALVAFLGRREA